ncbi:MAG TPA: serine hydrolase domain-containing protein [Sphingobacteriaceae bacterium]
MRFFQIIIAASIIIFLFQSCTQNKKEARIQKQELRDPKADSISLVYDHAKADKRIDEFMKRLHRNRGFNGNVLVAKKGKIIYQNAIGWADYLHRDSLKINSKFELASVSKPITSTAVLLLVEQGKLRLDQDVREFFPNFPYEGITVKLLLTHRSGMMNYVYFVDGLWKKQKKDERKGITNMDVMNLIAENKPARYSAPDVRFHYNNSNYMVLAAIIEKVTGKSYADFLQENIFKPIGMKNTAVYSKAVYDKIPVDVVGHDRGSWRYSVVQNFLDGPVGDKGVYSTVQDLFLFDRALRDGRLLKKETLDSAYTPHNKMERGHFNYGYGWRLFIDGDHKVAYHTGWWHGFRHIYLRDLNKDITIVLLTNLSNGSLHQLDELYKMVGMPVVRRGAYYGNGETASDD